MFLELKPFAQQAMREGAEELRAEIAGDGNLRLLRKDGSAAAVGSPDVAMAFEELSEQIGFRAGAAAAELRKNGSGIDKLGDTKFGALVRTITQMNWLASESMRAVEERMPGPATGLANGFAMVEATEVFIRLLTLATLEDAARE